MATQRIAFFDNLKGMLIFLVVLGHCLSYMPDVAEQRLLSMLVVFIYSFHMPAFIFVSGLFAYKTCTVEKGFRAENVLFYLALYLLFCLLKSLEELCMGNGFSFNPLVQGAAPWYLLVMTTYTLMTPLLRHIKPAVMLPMLVLAAVGGMYLIDGEIRGVLAIARTLAYAPVFAAGFYIGAAQMTGYIERTLQHPRIALLRLAALAVLVGFFVVLCLVPEHLAVAVKRICTGQNTALTMGAGYGIPLPLFGLARLLFYPFVAVLTAAVMLLTPRRRFFISAWGERSLQVYIAHMLVIYAMAHYGLNAAMLEVSALWAWSPLVVAPLMTALLAAPSAPLAWTAALKRLCTKAVAHA